MFDDSHGKRAGLLFLYGSIFLLALNGLFSKVIPLDVGTMIQARSVIAALVLFLVLLMQKARWRLASLRQYIGVYTLGILLAAHWLTYFHSMQVSTVAIGMLSLFSYPVITVILEPLLHKEWPKFTDILAASVVFFGVFLLVANDVLAGNLSSGAVEGAFWGIVSAIFFSLRNTTQKHYFSGIDSISLMGHQVIAVSILCLPFINIEQIKAMSSLAWGQLLLLGCFSTALAHTLLSMSLKRLPAKSVALISCVVPVLGALLAWFTLGEMPQLMVYVGGSLILSTAAYETLKQG